MCLFSFFLYTPALQKINTVSRYALIKEEIQIGSLVYTNLNSLTNVFKQKNRYDATTQET